MRFEFQAANAIAPGSKEVDPKTVIPAPDRWTSDIRVANGRQFIRYRVIFHIDEEGMGEGLSINSSKPTLRWLKLPFEF